MASGRQIADENILAFSAWVAAKTHTDFRSMAIRGVLSRTEIAAECGFAKSALSQNPRIREALAELERELREAGVLPMLSAAPVSEVQEPRMRPPGVTGVARDAERLKRLEQENASLRAEVAELKLLLGRYTVLQEALAETGRLPR